MEDDFRGGLEETSASDRLSRVMVLKRRCVVAVLGFGTRSRRGCTGRRCSFPICAMPS